MTMKRIILLLSAAFALASCQITEIANEEAKNDGNTVIFNAVTTKISMGAEDSGSFPLLWESGDAIDIWNADFTEKLGTANLVSGAGEENASFAYSGTIDDGTTVNLVYPAGNDLIIPKEQENDKFYGCAQPTVRDGKAEFSLEHPAYIKFVLGSTAFADWKVKEILFDCYKMPLSGNYIFDGSEIEPATEVTPTDGLTDGGFKVTLDTPVLLSSTPEIMGAAIPADLSGKNVYVTLKLVKDGEETVISKKISGKALAPNSINTISWKKVDHIYTNLSIPVVFKCYGASSDLEQLYPMWAQRRAGKDGNTYGTGEGIFLNDSYGVTSTAYGDVQMSQIHIEANAGNPETYALAKETDGHLAFAPAYEDDAFVLHIPISHVDAEKTLVFAVGIMGSNNNSPNKWTAEYSIDGKNWTAFETSPTIEIAKKSSNVGKGFYTIAEHKITDTIDNSILHIRLRADGDGTINGATGNRTVRFIFHKDHKATLGGPAVWVE